MGGAYGHMDHPYDVSTVTNGSELLKLFNQVKTLVEKPGASSVKLDGTNVSFKLVDGHVGKEFAVDRGSFAAVDLEGITIDRIGEKWAPPEPGKREHGMRIAVPALLTILNEALPKLRPVLEKMGMWNDSTRFLNTEYVSGTTNVTEYDEKFLAIHNLSQFYERTSKSGKNKGAYRAGAPRPLDPESGKPVAASGREIMIDPTLLEKMVEILRPIAAKYEFQVYGDVPTERMEAQIEFDSVLSEPFSVLIAKGNPNVAGSQDKIITKTVGEWLKEVQNPGYSPIRMRNGKKLNALHGNLYLTILNKTAPLLDIIEDVDVKKAIHGAIMFHTTRMLGNQVLRGLTSPMGDLVNHEGVVVRDDKLSKRPFKITGDFMVKNRKGGFGTDTPSQTVGEGPTEETEEVVKRRIAVVPGAFKPPHMGHADMVQHYANEADEVIVLISKPLKAGRKLRDGTEITAEHSQQIWDLYKQNLGMQNVTIMPSPQASPISAVYDYIGKDGPLEPDTEVILGASTKPNKRGRPDWMRWKGAEKYAKEGVEILDPQEHAADPLQRSDGADFSATDMRELISDYLEEPTEDTQFALEEYVGSGNVQQLMDIITGGLKEMSSGSGGNSVGAPESVGKPRRRKLKTTNEGNYVIDAVMRLIMEKGIAQ